MLDQGHPETWNWEEHGREVIGYAERVETARTVNGDCEILVLKVRNESDQYELRSVWVFHTALANKLAEKNIKAGDLVGIRQLGEREPKGGGRKYMDYNVVVHSARGTNLGLGGTRAAALPVGEPEIVEGVPVDEPPPMEDTGRSPSPSSGDW